MDFEQFSKDFDAIVKEFGMEDDAEINETLKHLMFMNDPSSLEKMKKTPHQKALEYLRYSNNALTKKESLKYAKKALNAEPENIDAQVSVALLSAPTLENSIPKLKKIFETNTALMKENGFFEDDKIGKFWDIFSTRPYMRLLDEYSGTLYDCGKLKAAAEIYVEMLRLCESDDLGARHMLMYIYAFLEDEESALKLAKKYPYDQMVKRYLPLSILYYKLGNMRKSSRYLRKLREVNKDTLEFFCSMKDNKLQQYYHIIKKLGYNVGCIGEFIEEAELHQNLFASIPNYFKWAYYKMSEAKNLDL